jgi:hypothetical protein
VRPFVIYSGSYVVLFVLHILFAANELDLLFQIVAMLLVCMTFLCGPLLWYLDQITVSMSHNQTTLGFVVSLPLSLGIAYAYAGMEFELSASFLALLLTSLTHGAWFLFLKGK